MRSEGDIVSARESFLAARPTNLSFLLEQRGWTEVTVDPVIDNIRAIRAFERAGFTSEGEALDEETGKRILRMVARREEGPADP